MVVLLLGSLALADDVTAESVWGALPAEPPAETVPAVTIPVELAAEEAEEADLWSAPPAGTPPMPTTDPALAAGIQAALARGAVASPVARPEPRLEAERAPKPERAPRPERVAKTERVVAAVAVEPSVAPYERPTRYTAAPNRYGNTDISAYTLEPGEASVGLGAVEVGVVRNVQVGTSPVFDALRVFNLSAKVDAIRRGPVDVGFQASGFTFAGETMVARWGRVGATTSVAASDAVGLHAGVSYASLHAEGVPNLDPIAPLFNLVAGWRPSAETIAEAEEGLDFTANAQFVSARLAGEYRFNRRDSLVLVGESVVWGQSALPADLSAGLTGGTPIPASSAGFVSPADAYVTSLSYQASFRNLDLRFGIGMSSVPGAWLLQSTEIAWRFGGPTRQEERARALAWRDAGDSVAMADELDATR